MAIFPGSAIPSAVSDYTIDQSLRFNAEGELYRTPTSSGSQRKYTVSCWVKRGNIAGRMYIFSSFAASLPYNAEELDIKADESLRMQGAVDGNPVYELQTNRLFRDPSAWYHVVKSVDTTESVEADRIQLWVNGERITSWATTTYCPLNEDLTINTSSYTMHVGYRGGPYDDYNLDGYLAEFYFVDGTALDASSFGETDSTTNQWKPIEYDGTYGTNGFYQKYANTELANSFTDSAEGHAVTVVGDTHTDTSEKKVGTASAQFDGVADYLEFADSSDWALGTTGTIECWLYMDSSPTNTGQQTIWAQQDSSSDRFVFWVHGTTQEVLVKINDTDQFASVDVGLSFDTWHHIALVFDGTNARWYTDGVQKTSAAIAVAGGVPDMSAVARIGWQVSDGPFEGYIDEWRISDNVRYPDGTTFTTFGQGGGTISSPTNFSTDANTLLLLHMDGANDGVVFTDSSGRPKHTCTAVGNVANSRAQSKFSSSAVYSYAWNDNIGITPHILLPQEFTWEGWVRFENATPGETKFFSIWDGTSIGGHDNRSYRIWYQDGTPSLGFAVSSDGDNPNSSEIYWNWTPSQNTWYYISVGRDSSDDCRAFVDGSQVGSTQELSRTAFTPDVTATDAYLAGQNGVYYQDVQFSTTNRYTTTYSVPTTSVTPDSDTVLLINSDWGGGPGLDSSGNGNNLTPSGLVATDQMEDSPTNNFCTINALHNLGSNTLSEGNLQVVESGGWNGTGGTLGASSGKWYFEIYCKTSTEHLVGAATDLAYQEYAGNDANGRGYYGVSGNKYNNGNQGSYGATFTAGDVIGVALDLENDSIYFAKNNTWQDSGDPTSGASKTGAAFTDLTSGTWFPQVGGSAITQVLNTGSDSSFAGNLTAQGNQDGNEIGDFYYAPPSGFLALCTSNLPTPEIALPTDHFNTVLFTGTGLAHAITGVGFQPDLNWLKNRTTAGTNYNLTDAVRGVDKQLYSNDSVVEQTDSTIMTAFGADGFTVGTSSDINGSTNNIVSWNWKGDGVAGGTLNEVGTIDSQVNVNTTAGFSIVSYTGDGGSSATIGHSLSQAPELVIVKNIDAAENWAVGSSEGMDFTDYIILNTSAAAADDADIWNDATPSATVFTVGTSNLVNNTDDYIAYCFHSIEGYSKIGSYVGNGSTDGVFCYCGFQPRYILCKNTSETGGNWWVIDSERSGGYGNEQVNALIPNLSNAGYNTGIGDLDFVSNGIKFRGFDDNNYNKSGVSYMFYAIAETPFRTSNAR